MAPCGWIDSSQLVLSISRMFLIDPLGSDDLNKVNLNHFKDSDQCQSLVQKLSQTFSSRCSVLSHPLSFKTTPDSVSPDSTWWTE